jgi:hypothetical protein
MRQKRECYGSSGVAGKGETKTKIRVATCPYGKEGYKKEKEDA